MDLKRTNTGSSKNGEAYNSSKQTLRGQSSNHSRNGNPEFQTPMQQKNSNFSGRASIHSAIGYQTNPDAQKAPLIKQNQSKLYSSNQAQAKHPLLRVAKKEDTTAQRHTSNIGGILSSENASTLPSTSAKNRLSSQSKIKISPQKRGKQASVDFGSSAKKSNYSSGHKINQSFDLSMFAQQQHNLADSIIEEEENYKFQTLNTDESSQSFNQLRLGNKDKNEQRATTNDQKPMIGKIYRNSAVMKNRDQYIPSMMSNTHANSETAAATKGSNQRRKSQQTFQTQINQILGEKGRVIDNVQDKLPASHARNQQSYLYNQVNKQYATETQEIRQKLVANLSKQYEKEIDGNYLLQDLMRLKDQNEILRQKYKEIVEYNEEIKLLLRCNRNDSINKNLEVQENLRKVLIDINILEKSYFRMREDIYYLERQINDKWKIETCTSQIQTMHAQKQDLIDSRKFYRTQIQRIKDDLAQHQSDYQGFISQENAYSSYKTKSLAIILMKRSLTKLLDKEERSLSKAFFANLKQKFDTSRKRRALLSLISKKNISQEKIETDSYFRKWLKLTIYQKKLLQTVMENLNEKQRDNIHYSCFYKWRELFIKTLSRKSSQKIKALKFIEAYKLRIHRKSVCNAFLVWKNQNQLRNIFLLKLRNVIMNKKRKDLRWAFNFWNNEFNYLADKLKCFSMLQRRSTKQLKARAFYGLREAVKLQKFDTFQSKMKFYKEWRYRFFQSRYVKNMQPGKLGFRLINLGSEQLLIQRVFNALRKNCLQNQQNKALKQHNHEVEFKTQACLTTLKREESHSQSRNLRVLKNCILRWQGLRVRSYFEYWRDLIVNYKRVNQVSLYRKLANFKLNQAFGQWKYKAQQARNNQKYIKNSQSHYHTLEKQKQIEVLKSEIEQINSVRMTLAKSRILKAASHQEKLRIKDQFCEWRIKMFLARKQFGKLRLIFAKVTLNRKRVYFQRYQRQARKASRYLNHQSILSRYESILHSRLSRYFLSILKNNKQVGDEKRSYLGRISQRKQRKTYQPAFKQWIAALNQSQISLVNTIEMNQIDSYSSVMQEVVMKQSHLQEQNSAITKCEKTLTKFGASNIAKYINRVKNYQQSKAFATWKEQSIQFKSQKRCLKHFIMMMKKNDKKILFLKWKEHANSHNMLVLNSRINYIDQSLNRNTLDHKQNCQDLQQRREKLMARLQTENTFVNKYQKIQQGIVGILFRQKNELVETKLHHWVLRNWRARNLHLKQKFRRLEIMLSNHSIRQGFDSINKMYGQFNQFVNNQQDIRKAKLQKAAILIFKGFKRSAFSQWRAHSFSNVISFSKEKHLEIMDIQEGIKQNKLTHKSQITQMLDITRQSFSMQNTFEAWRTVIKLRSQFKAKTEAFMANQHRIQISSSLQRWSHKSKRAKLQRSKIQNFKEKQTVKLLNRTFDQLRITSSLQKKQRLLIKNSLDLLIKTKIVYGFNAILNFTRQKTIQFSESKEKSARKIFQVAISQQLNKQRSAFSQWISNTRLLKLQQLKVKSIMRLANYHKKQAFNKWTRLVQLINQNKECELYSTVQQEILQNRMKNLALIELITQKEKILTANQLQKMLHQEKECQQNKMKNLLFVIRNINAETQTSNFCLYKCFKLLKQSGQQRRQIRIKLSNVVSRKCDYLRHCFAYWKNFNQNLISHYSGLKRDVLVKTNSYNVSQRKNLEKREDATEVQEYSLYSQSEVMEANLLRARRLAIRLLKKRDQKYLQQSISVWKQVNDVVSKQNLRLKLEKRQQILSQLMTQASIIEKSNRIMNDQNHEYKNQNVMAILRGEDLLQSSKENETMMLDLADKNLQIRRLIEENRSLSIRLSQTNLNNSMIRQQTLAKARS